MAKFKVGDKVTDGNSVFQITKVNPDDYGWKLVKGDGKDAFGKSISAGGMISWADQKMRKAANAVTSKNPVVANAISAKNAVAKNAVDPLDALNSAETKMREAIGELGKVTDPDLRPLASRIATKLKAVQGELRRELAV